MQIKNLCYPYKWRFFLTLALILAEAAMMLLFPLVIGYAIDDVINLGQTGVFLLGALGLGLLIIGVGRRLLDSRFYGKIYKTTAVKVIREMKGSRSSVKTARLHMMRELVEFLENALPELINHCIGLVGVVLMLYSLDIMVFYGSLAVTLAIFLVYWSTRKKTMSYNEASNNEMERQVDVLARNEPFELRDHLQKTIRWNIKLSDLEAFNFSISWMFALVFLVAAIVVSADNGTLQYGMLFALVMYVFQYIENVLNLPLFYQNWLRLREIVRRLEEPPTTANKGCQQ